MKPVPLLSRQQNAFRAALTEVHFSSDRGPREPVHLVASTNTRSPVVRKDNEA